MRKRHKKRSTSVKIFTGLQFLSDRALKKINRTDGTVDSTLRTLALLVDKT